MLRLVTIKRMAERSRQTLFRVRRRAYSGKAEVDKDGVEGRPETWSRWTEEYYRRRVEALAAATDTRGPNSWRPAGVIDREVTARELWARVSHFDMMEEGRLAFLYEQVRENPRYARGELDEQASQVVPMEG